MPSRMEGHLASFPVLSWFGGARISLFGGLVPCPAGDVNAQEDRHGLDRAGSALRKPDLALQKLKTRQVLTTFKCAGEFDCVGSSSDFIAASTPPARCGTPAAARPISTPDKAPIKVSSLHSPRWPMRNTLPASLLKPEPSDML